MATLQELSVEQLLERKQLLQQRKELLSQRASGEVKRTPDKLDKFAPQILAERGGRGEAEFKGGMDSNIFGDVNRPAEAFRTFVRGQGAMEGFVNQEKVPSFVEQSQQSPVSSIIQPTGNKGFIPNIQNAASNFEQFQKGLGRDILATGADIATDVALNPLETLTTLVGGKVISKLAKSPVGEGIGAFLTKPRKFMKFGKAAVQEIAEKAATGRNFVLKQASKKYDDLLSKLDESVSKKGNVVLKEGSTLADSIDDVINTYPDSPNMAKLGKISSRLREGKATSITDLHNLKQETRSVVPKSVWRGSSRPDAMQKAQRDLYFKTNEVIESLDDTGVYKGLSNEYRELMNTVDDLNSAILERGRPGEAKLRKDALTLGRLFDQTRGLTYRQRLAMETIDKQVPNKMKFMQDFKAWKRGNLVRDAAIGIGAAGLLYGSRRRVGETIIEPTNNNTGN